MPPRRRGAAPAHGAADTQQLNGGAAPSCDAPWAKEAGQVAEELSVDVRVGLSDEEVAQRRQQYGFNELEKEPGARPHGGRGASALVCACSCAHARLW